MKKIDFIILLLFKYIISLNYYIIESIKYSNDKTSLIANVTFDNKKKFKIAHYSISPLQNKNIKIIKKLQLQVNISCDGIFHYKIIDREKQRYEANLTDEDYIKYINTCDKNKYNLDNFGFEINKVGQRFEFKLKYNNEIYLYFNKNNFFYSDNLIVFDQELTNDLIFGFGERVLDFKLGLGKYTIWPNDTTLTYRDKRTGGYNLMGHQPIGLHRTEKGLYVGLVFLNTNAQDVVIQKPNILSYLTFSKKVSLEHRTIGGIIDYYITIGKTADEAISKIHKIIGRPAIPPFWGLGWHQCRWGYHSSNNLKEVKKYYDRYELPLESLWTDIDMMKGAANFQLSYKFKDMPNVIEDFHKDGKRFVALVDFALPNQKSDKYFNLGSKLQAFIISNYTKKPLLTYVWPGVSVFPDMFSENGKILWITGLKDYYNLLNYDGMWIDMNEPSMIYVLKNGEGENVDKKIFFNKSLDIYSNIPYIPGYRKNHYDLTTKSVSLNAYSNLNDPENNFYTYYNIRPLTSKNQVTITNLFFKSVDRRPFIVSRANTIGHGKYGFHWLGDNNSTFKDLKNSITGIFNYNIFGIPFTGADVCGFHGDSTDELCARWHNLAALYPFTRNHNEIHKKSQEPYAFYERNRHKNRTLNAAKVAINLKYSILRYIYSELMLISIGEKGSYFKPAFFEFDDDKKLLENNDIMNTYIMAGSALYYIPNLNENENRYQGYFPNSNFNEFPSGKKILDYNKKLKKGKWFYLDGSYNKINLYLRGGYIIPYQNVSYPTKVLSSKHLRERPIDLVINIDENYKAKGNIFYDIDQTDILTNKNFTYIKIYFNLDSIYFNIINKGDFQYIYNDNIINNIVIYRINSIINKINKKIDYVNVISNNRKSKRINSVKIINNDILIIKEINETIENINFIKLK